ncbi:hypothetical protein QQ045_003734 [Rhodiola kirilowii]
MPITARRNRNDVHRHPNIHAGAVQESNPHQHPTPNQRQVKLPSAGVLSVILRGVIMCVLTSLFFFFVALATILLIHVFLAGRQLRRRRQTPRHNPNAFSREDLTQLAELEYCKHDRDADSDPECVICLEVFGDGARYRILPGCGHVFHLNCIDAWLVKAAVCPVCRASIRLSAAEAARNVDQSGMGCTW